MANDEFLKSQGIIGPNEQFETLYLADDEIEKFMENYLKENPGTEIETRYINHPPVELTQNIEVRWLRPETPEIPPIIIKEVNTFEPELPPIRIIEKRKEEKTEPLIIREKPPFIVIPDPKIAYVQNLVKKQEKKESQFEGKPIKIEHVKSESQNNLKTRLEFEEHASIIDYEEEYGQVPDDTFRSKYRYEDEQELRLYEEKLKQTLYEEYLLRLERERLERKLSKSGLLEERLRERSISQERMSQMTNKYSNVREDSRLRQDFPKINESLLDSRTQYRKDYQTTSSSKQNVFINNSSSNDLGHIPRTESQKKYMDDLKAYEMYNQSKSPIGKVSDNSIYNSNDTISNSASSNAIRRHRITTIKNFWIIVYGLVILLKKAYSYSYMVPQESCMNLYPIHNSTKQLSNPPLEIIVNKKVYHPNEIIKVSLIGIDNFHFIGFILQARIYQKRTIIGSWALDEANHEFIGILKCYDSNNSLVHAWPEFYTESNKFFTNVTATWLAPKITTDEIEFVATVVQKYDRFWTDIKSKKISPNIMPVHNLNQRCRSSNFNVFYLIYIFVMINF
ncbi:unnamed protein product [Brachionus calyciflorus]|uniref:Reelin domain-containing protein n=1 Tax=Brachionus calyciflorus TaxID=104777 RepID=A0A813MGX1_9BILA|nr:unnamed protein product [Brachionus calyciflorus]